MFLSRFETVIKTLAFTMALVLAVLVMLAAVLAILGNFENLLDRDSIDDFHDLIDALGSVVMAVALVVAFVVPWFLKRFPRDGGGHRRRPGDGSYEYEDKINWMLAIRQGIVPTRAELVAKRSKVPPPVPGQKGFDQWLGACEKEWEAGRSEGWKNGPHRAPRTW